MENHLKKQAIEEQIRLTYLIWVTFTSSIFCKPTFPSVLLSNIAFPNPLSLFFPWVVTQFVLYLSPYFSFFFFFIQR